MRSSSRPGGPATVPTAGEATPDLPPEDDPSRLSALPRPEVRDPGAAPGPAESTRLSALGSPKAAGRTSSTAVTPRRATSATARPRWPAAREIVQTAVPFGCPRRWPGRLARSTRLEVDYAAWHRRDRDPQPFADAATARAFFAGRRDNLHACVGRGGGAVGPLVTDVQPVGPGAPVNGRTQRSTPWMELAVLDGDSVVLLAPRASRSAAARPATAPRLAAAFRTR